MKTLLNLPPAIITQTPLQTSIRIDIVPVKNYYQEPKTDPKERAYLHQASVGSSLGLELFVFMEVILHLVQLTLFLLFVMFIMVVFIFVSLVLIGVLLILGLLILVVVMKDSLEEAFVLLGRVLGSLFC